MKIPVLVITCLTLTFLAIRPAKAGGRYRMINPEYLFSVNIPYIGKPIKHIPPAPLHSVGVKLPDGSEIWADGSNTEDILLEPNLQRELIGWPNCQVRAKKPVHIAGRPGIQIESVCDTRSRNPSVILVLTTNKSKGRSPILYVLGLACNASSCRADRAEFERMVKSFRILKSQ